MNNQKDPILPKVLEYLVEKRKEVKKEMKRALKENDQNLFKQLDIKQ